MKGTLELLPLQNFFDLRLKKYPSLYKDRWSQGIVIGPLSLVNHCCSSAFSFSRIRISETRGKVESMRAKAMRSVSVDAGEEFTVNYGRKRSFGLNANVVDATRKPLNALAVKCSVDECSWTGRRDQHDVHHREHAQSSAYAGARESS